MSYRKRVPQTLAVLGLAVLGLSACSSAASAPTQSAPTAAQSASTAASNTNSNTNSSAGSQAGQAADGAVAAVCERVSGVLADGPDPDADPVGYAEAQVAPLHRIQTQDAALRDAVGKLADAYQEFFTTNGTKPAKEAVSVASSAINKICPGATS